MKWALGFAVAALVLGAWAGFLAYGSASLETQVLTGLAVLIGCNLVFAFSVWHRAKPDSADRMVLPSVKLMSAVMLITILPRLLWPGAGRLQLAGSIVSAVVLVLVLIT